VRIKKSPSAASLADLTALYGSPRHQTDPTRRVAQDLTKLFGHLPQNALNAAHIAALVANWKDRLSVGTRYVYLKALRRILRDIGPTLGDPQMWRCVPRLHMPPPNDRTITQNQRYDLLAKCPTWLQFFVLLCADMGLRFASAATVKVGGWNPQTKLLTFRKKGGLMQTLPATIEVSKYLATLRPEHAPDITIIEALAGKPYSLHGVRNAYERAKKNAGLPANLNPHAFRYTFATNLFAKTHDLRAVQQALGHESLHTTGRYIANKTNDELRSMLESLKPYTEVPQ
jgi:integrase